MKKEPTSDAVEILHRLYGNGFWRRWSLWLARRKLRKERQDYADGFCDGHKSGYKEGVDGWSRVGRSSSLLK